MSVEAKEAFEKILSKYPRSLLGYVNPYQSWSLGDRYERVRAELDYRTKNLIPIQGDPKSDFDRGEIRPFLLGLNCYTLEGNHAQSKLAVSRFGAFKTSTGSSMTISMIIMRLEDFEPVLDGEIRLSVLEMCGLVKLQSGDDTFRKAAFLNLNKLV